MDRYQLMMSSPLTSLLIGTTISLRNSIFGINSDLMADSQSQNWKNKFRMKIGIEK